MGTFAMGNDDDDKHQQEETAMADRQARLSQHAKLTYVHIYEMNE